MASLVNCTRPYPSPVNVNRLFLTEALPTLKISPMMSPPSNYFRRIPAPTAANNEEHLQAHEHVIDVVLVRLTVSRFRGIIRGSVDFLLKLPFSALDF
jgi:hypothetical protein